MWARDPISQAKPTVAPSPPRDVVSKKRHIWSGNHIQGVASEACTHIRSVDRHRSTYSIPDVSSLKLGGPLRHPRNTVLKAPASPHFMSNITTTQRRQQYKKNRHKSKKHALQAVKPRFKIFTSFKNLKILTLTNTERHSGHLHIATTCNEKPKMQSGTANAQLLVALATPKTATLEPRAGWLCSVSPEQCSTHSTTSVSFSDVAPTFSTNHR